MPDPQYIDASDDPRLPALMAWRQRLIDAGAVSRTSFKEAHLRLVLRSGRTDVAQIRAMLPPSVAEHAEDMARMLARARKPKRHWPIGPHSVRMSSSPTRLGPMPLTWNSTIGQAISLRSDWVSRSATCTPSGCGGGATKASPVPSS